MLVYNYFFLIFDCYCNSGLSPCLLSRLNLMYPSLILILLPIENIKKTSVFQHDGVEQSDTHSFVYHTHHVLHKCSKESLEITVNE